jgi:hypothetical protein
MKLSVNTGRWFGDSLSRKGMIEKSLGETMTEDFCGG